MWKRSGCVLTMLCALALTRVGSAEEPREIFHVTFDGSPNASVARGNPEPYQARADRYIDGVVGQALVSEGVYNGIRWDGRGNIDLERGTFALFYQPLKDPGASQYDSFFGVSTDIEGNWAGIINFLNKKDQGRDARPEFVLRFCDINRHAPALKFQPVFERWHKDEWHHIAMVWDRNQGITIYEDGQRVDSNWDNYRWDWNFPPRMLVLGNWQYSTTPFAVDELRIYADCLTDEQIAQLARAEAPTGAPLPRQTAERTRDADLARMGWTAEDLDSIPRVEADKPLRMTFSRITQCVDAKRLVAQPFEGLKGSCWPIQKYGPSTAGGKLDIHFAADQAFDRVRIFSHGPFSGELREARSDGKLLMKIDSRRPVWHGQFDALRSDDTLALIRPAGAMGVIDFFKATPQDPQSIGQIDFYRCEPAAEMPANRLTYGAFSQLDKMPNTLTGRAVLGDTPVHFDNPVLAETGPVRPWRTVSPPFGGFQLITPTLVEPVAMDGVVLTLVAERLSGPTPVSITVKEPVLPQRDWLAADVVLVPTGRDLQTFTIHLSGRPVISYPKDELKIGRDRVLSDPGRELAVMVTVADPVTWVMGTSGCSLSLCLTDMEAALPVAAADQIEFSREAYAEHNEGHIWDVIGAPGWGRLHYPLKWLMHFAPDERPTMQLAMRVGYRAESLPYEAPVNDIGAPEWAFWQREAFNECKRMMIWIIENRGVETGEFGGVWGDDTDMTEYWTHVALAGDDDGMIANALRKFWVGLYDDCLKDGVSEAVRDNLHSYEEGMGCIAHQLLLDYGDPNAVERTMRASAHYDKWMAQNDDGSWRFLGNYLGWDGVWTEGAFGKDTSRNTLMLIPAAYLVWYNRHPVPVKYISGWPLVLETPSIAADAALRLRGDVEFQRKWNEEQAWKFIDQGRYFHRINCLLDETGVKDEWRERMLAVAKNSYGHFLDGGLPAYAGYSPVLTEVFWLAYKATDDIEYLTRSYKQACVFINNQDWLYTVAQPSTDRIPLPDTSAIRARLGAFVTERGGHTNTWPRHGISYVKGADEIAALVTDNDDRNLAVRLYCFSEAEHTLQVRLWKLLPGSYTLRLSTDRDDDGKAEEMIYERRIEVDRGAYQDLRLPPRRCSLLEVRAIEMRDPVYDLPDVAIGRGDVRRDVDGRIMVRVHNIGTQPVEDLLVRVTNSAGEVVTEQTVSIPAPLDLQARVAVIVVPNLLDMTRGKLTVSLDPEQAHPDMNRYNNEIAFE